MSSKHTFLLICLSFLLAHCSKDTARDLNNSTTLFVDDNLKPYFDSFARAGEERGVTIDFVALRIQGYLSNMESDIAGNCSYDNDSPRTITINEDYWQKSNTLEREYLIFHELGHCYLERGHRNDQQTNGSCASIMESGLAGCRYNYNARTRASYLDELFQ